MPMFEQKRAQVMPLAAILKMMDDANSKMFYLLHRICKKSPKDVDHYDFPDFIVDAIHISCPCRRGLHSVPPLVFLLLEEVEHALGSAMQEITLINTGAVDEPWLSAVASRVSRQEGKMTRVELYNWVTCTTKKSVEALSTLIQNSETAFLFNLEVVGNIEAEGWAVLARALSSASVSVDTVWAARELVVEGMRKDLRTIWEALRWGWAVGDKGFYKVPGPVEKEWSALEHILDGTQDEDNDDDNDADDDNDNDNDNDDNDED